MKKNCCFLILILCVSCSVFKKNSYNPTLKYSPLALKEDVSILHKTLKANHPSLYWYTPKDSIDYFFSAAYNSLQDSLTEQQFRKKISWVLNKIRCGHTVARASKNYSKYYSEQKTKSFPLLLKVWDDSAVVISNLSEKDSILKRGTIVLAINGLPIKNITDSICTLISADGYSNIFKYQLMSFNFPAFYRNAYGLDSNYVIQYIDSTGKNSENTISNTEDKYDFLNTNQQYLSQTVSKKQLRRLDLLLDRNINIDSLSNTGFLSVNTFNKGKLIRFFHHAFKEIHQKKIANVVLDLRLNSGGSVMACARLSQYLIDKPFNVADTVAAINRSFQYKKYLKPWFIYLLSMHISGKRYEDGRIHFRYFEKHYFKPKKKNHFDGNIYILTGGYTFSAATLVVSNLKGQPNVTIVGEETGGGSYGNSAMLLSTITLPHTGLRVTLPLFRMVLDTTRIKNGRGIFPDVEVKPSSDYIRRGIDPKIKKTMEMIKKK